MYYYSYVTTSEIYKNFLGFIIENCRIWKMYLLEIRKKFQLK